MPAGYQVLLPEYVECGTMDADGFSIVDNRAGVTFGVELYVPWDALEMAVDLSSTGTVPLRNFPDVFGMIGRSDSATESLSATESHVSIPELSELAHKWPPAVINHMRWRQPELEEMRKAATVQYRKKQPSPCEFCGTLIRCDMYRHVVCCHLDLAQLWWCPVSWCTVWKGTPQDLMDHVRGAHKVPEEVLHIKLETLFPPWTVTRQVHTDSLTSRHSGISNDVLLFSDIGLSLVHHYRVHKRGLPHVAFRRNYMSQLRALLALVRLADVATLRNL